MKQMHVAQHPFMQQLIRKLSHVTDLGIIFILFVGSITSTENNL